jgi:hypothetical protein
VLHTMDLSRLQCGDGGSDRVGSHVCLGPLSALLEVYDAADICRSWISRCLNNDSRWVCEDDDSPARGGIVPAPGLVELPLLVLHAPCEVEPLLFRVRVAPRGVR